MSKRDLPGIIDIDPTRSKRHERKDWVYVVYRAPGNREPLYTTELLSNKRKAYQNIVASCRLHSDIDLDTAYTSPLVRDKTVTPERFIRLDIVGSRYKVIEVGNERL